MNIVQHARLTTGGRAVLSIALIVLITSVYTAIAAIVTSSIDWNVVIIVATVVTLATFGHTIATYLTTNDNNIPLVTMLEAESSAMEKRLEPAQPAARQFVVIPPGSSLTTRAEPIVLPVQTVPPMVQGNISPSSSGVMSGTTQVPIVPPPPPTQ